MSMKPFIHTDGQGPDLVLVHGWGLHSGIWEPIYWDLRERFRVTLVDLPGFGRSPMPNSDYTMDMIIDQLSHIPLDKAHWLGWSLGGLVATEFALRFPDKVQSLVTVASNPKFVQCEQWPNAMKPDLMAGFCKYLEEDYEGTLIKFLAIQAIGSPTAKDDIRELKETVFIHGKPHIKALRGGLDMLDDVDHRHQVNELTMPTFRIYGRLDSLVPSKTADIVASHHPDSEYVVIKKASHAPFLSNKAEFLTHLHDFYQRKIF
jgi:pimeloyl-[acyl-carrier protein] methyl ester esterase